ncbi:TetR/AcrR family transcriptional regulator [Frankia sp. QA3]|uniref:TetR/AcrR family transcriptional regulator n=1 Tax=Frankia sp. QA3 TaxID=710111 RepID=UPI0012F7F9F7|nr:TetR/AcrR family transcriptional regulator [Frankia sp. QA3]
MSQPGVSISGSMPPDAAALGPAARTGGRAGKHAAITRAARRMFGRDGYSRTSIDAIATEAGVSTRTIYNHFESKEQLFSAVLHASAAQVADEFARNAERRLTGTDLEGDLVALGHAFVAQRTEFPEHFAMVEQIKTESSHFPPALIDAWQQAGPLRVRGEVARRLARLADAGLLRIGDPAVAAVHFIALATAGVSMRPYGSPPLDEGQTREAVRVGIDAFLNGYRAG